MSIERARAHLAQFGLAERIREFDVSSATVELAAAAVGVEPARKAHRLLPIALGDDPIAVDTADFHAKAVAAEVDGAK